ncbi:class I SAM-dependent methyltransferase [Ideonella sp.]|uniref:class I SAM-dependent methyltransferase n=1 Tax=Ideonella sp. TaxID=1929293 RepID=UPI0035AE094D
MQGDGTPSDWIVRWSHLVPAGGTVLDLACGRGRHTRWFAGRGHRVTALDRDAQAVQPLAALAEVVVADIEQGPWPLAGRAFDAVVVTHYLWRPLWPAIVQSVAPGGCLLYETFATGHEALGRPSRADFLLQPGELLRAAAPELAVVAYEAGRLDAPARLVQRLAAWRRQPGVSSAADDRPLVGA